MPDAPHEPVANPNHRHPPGHAFTENDLRCELHATYLGRGLHISENDDATVIEALVCGNDDYDVEIEITRAKNGRARFDGFCDRPISYNCKHVAATLLAALSMDRLSQSRSRGSSARAR